MKNDKAHVSVVIDGYKGLTAPALLGWGLRVILCVCLECVCVGRSPLVERSVHGTNLTEQPKSGTARNAASGAAIHKDNQGRLQSAVHREAVKI